MMSYVYRATVKRPHIDGSITFAVDLGFGTVQNRNFHLTNIMIVDWARYFKEVERLSMSPEIFVQSHRSGNEYTADVTYRKDDKWYNFILDLLEAEIVKVQ